MTIYYIIFVVLAALALVEVVTEDQTLKRCYPFVVAALVVFAGLRGDGVGFDFDTYRDMFDDVRGGGSVLIEPGFSWLMGMVGRAGGFHLLLFVMAAAAIGIKAWFVWRWSPYLYTGLLIYYATAMISNDMGQIRYGMAVALCLVAFHNVMTGHGWRALAWVAGAAMFHFSALIALPAIWIARSRISGRAMAVAVLLSAVFYVVSANDILAAAGRFIPLPYIQEKIGYYTAATTIYGAALGPNLSIAMRIAILWLVWRYRRVIAADTGYDVEVVGRIYFYGVVLYMVLSSNAEFASRGSGYFRIIEAILLPAVVASGKNYLNRLALWGGVAAAAVYFISAVLKAGFAEAYEKYHNVLF